MLGGEKTVFHSSALTCALSKAVWYSLKHWFYLKVPIFGDSTKESTPGTGTLISQEGTRGTRGAAVSGGRKGEAAGEGLGQRPGAPGDPGVLPTRPRSSQRGDKLRKSTYRALWWGSDTWRGTRGALVWEPLRRGMCAWQHYRF